MYVIQHVFCLAHSLWNVDVDLSIICNFNRVKALSTNKKEIIAALHKSQSLALSEDETRIRRKVPYRVYDAKARTVYAVS